MADKAKSLLQKLHLKPSTTLKVSKTAIFVLLGLISVQTVVGGLLWYAKQIKAASGLQYVKSYAEGNGAAKVITRDSQNNLYAYDLGSYTIKKYDTSGNDAGQIGTNGSGVGEYGDVSGMAVDSQDNLYVLDSGNTRVIKYGSNGSYSGITWGSYGTNDGEFASLSAIAINASNEVYVVDGGNSRVQRFSSIGGYIGKWGSVGTAAGQFTYPYGITTDSAGSVYVTEGFSGRVQKFGAAGGTPTVTWTLGGNWGGYMATGPGDKIYVTSLNGKFVREYNTSGMQQNSWGGSGSGSGTFGGSYLDGTITVDTTGSVYVADYGNAHIQKFTAAGVYTGVYTGRGIASQVRDVATDGAGGNIYEVGGGTLRKVRRSDGRLLMSVSIAGSAVDVSPDGSFVYVLSQGWSDPNSRMTKLTSAGVVSAQWGTFGEAENQFKGAEAMAVGSDGSVYVADTANHRIQKFDANGVFQRMWGWGVEDGSSAFQVCTTGCQTGIAGNGDGQFDMTDWYGTGYNRGIDVDSQGNVYVADMHNARIQKFSSAGAFSGKWGVFSDSQGNFKYPYAIAIDGQDNIYIACLQGAGERIQRFNSSMQFVSQITTSGNTVLDDPEGIATDEQGHLYVADTSNNRIQQFTYGSWLSLVSDGSYAGIVGDPYSTNVIVEDPQGPLTFTVAAGQLPPGLSLNATTGEISGTPTLAGDYWSTIDITDGQTTVQATPFIVISDPPPDPLAFTSATLPNARAGVAYSHTIGLSNVVGTPHYENISGIIRYDQQGNQLGWASGSEMGFNTTTGLLSGTPISTAGTYRFTLEAYDDRWQVVSQQFTLVVDSAHQVTTLPATNIVDGFTDITATLNGATNYPDEITARGFQYGLDTNYGTQIADTTVAPGYTEVQSWDTVANIATQSNGGWGMALDKDENRYLVDSANNRILKYSKSGVLQATWGSAGAGDGQFDAPADIAIGPSGKFYVIEGGNSRVQVLNSNGDYERQFAIPTGRGQSIAVDSNEDIYVSGDARTGPWYSYDWNPYLRKYDSSANFNLLIEISAGKGRDDGEFWWAADDLVVDSNDYLYAVDQGNNRVQKFDSAGQFDLKIGGAGPGNYGAGSTDGQFDQPRAIALDASNNVYVVDSGRAQRFGLNGAFKASWSVTRYYDMSIGVDLEGNVIASSYSNPHQLVKYSSAIQADISGLACSTTYHYRAFATNADGTKYGSDATFTTPDCPDTPINITNTSLLGGTEGTYYQDLVGVENDTGQVTYTVVSGNLPSGLSLNSSTGYITGTPNYGETANFTVRAQDSNSYDDQSYSITIEALPLLPLRITTTTLPDATLWYDTQYDNYDQYIYTEDYYSTVDFTVLSGSLPPGLELSNSGPYSARITGTPTTAGSYTFTLQANDSYRWQNGGEGSIATQQYTIVVPELILPVLYIETTSLVPGYEGLPYSRSIYYQDSRSTPVFSLVSGSLPEGISLGLEGYLQGTPTTPGTYTFTVQADDGFNTDTQELTLVINPAPPPVVNTPFVTITAPSNNTVFTGGAQAITGTGPANQTIALFVDNQQIGTTTANAEGLWAYSATGVAPGSHALDAKWIPGAEIMAVPVMDINSLRTVLKVYDTSTDTLIKEFVLPGYSQGLTAVVIPGSQKVHVFGMTVASNSSAAWEIDISTGGVEEFITPGYPIFSAIASLDGGKIYTMSMGDQLRAFTVGEGFGGATLDLNPGSGYDSPASLQISPDGSTLYALVFGGSASDYIDTLKSVSTADLTVQSSIDLTSKADPNTAEFATGFEVVGDVAYVSHISRFAPDAYYGQMAIRLYNLTNGSLIRSVGASPLNRESYGGHVPYGDGYVDVVNQVMYLSSLDNFGTTRYRRLLRLNLQTDEVTPIQSSAVDSISVYTVLRGLAAAPSAGKLYIPPYLIGGPSADIEVYSLNTQSLLSGPGYPIPAPNSYAFGSNFIASITPPKDSIAFSVPNGGTPTCEQQGNCPQTCEQTNTCPKVDCTTTNTCPKPPTCADTNTCPTTTVTPPTTSVTPKIISTQFPTPGATPSTSRLGWLDRTALAVARFVPQQAAIGFPYVLFVLLLCFALSLYYQSSNEIRKDKLNRDFLAKRTSIRAQQDNFIALASHYLNTPITIIQGGVELEEGKRGRR